MAARRLVPRRTRFNLYVSLVSRTFWHMIGDRRQPVPDKVLCPVDQYKYKLVNSSDMVMRIEIIRFDMLKCSIFVLSVFKYKKTLLKISI